MPIPVDEKIVTPVPIIECPSGLFIYKGVLGFKTNTDMLFDLKTGRGFVAEHKDILGPDPFHAVESIYVVPLDRPMSNAQRLLIAEDLAEEAALRYKIEMMIAKAPFYKKIWYLFRFPVRNMDDEEFKRYMQSLFNRRLSTVFDRIMYGFPVENWLSEEELKTRDPSMKTFREDIG